MSDSEPLLSEEEARRLWHRAAELQAEASKRLEERSRQLAPRSGDGPEAQGYVLSHVRVAAVEAGISAEFVDRALAEVQSGDGSLEGSRPGPVMRAFLGEVPDSLEASRVFHHPPDRVYEAMQRILPGPPYNLTLVDTKGSDPLNGAVLVFDVARYSYGMGGANESFSYEMTWVGLKQLHVALHPLSTDPPSCEVTIRSSLKSGRNTSFGVGVGLTALVGMLAVVIVGPVVGGVAGVALASGSLAGIGGLGALGWRRLFRYSLARSTRAMERLLSAIDGDIRTGGGFSRRGAWPESEPTGGALSSGQDGG